MLRGTGAVQGSVRTLLRLEGVAVLVAAATFYAWDGRSWLLFAALFLVPDLSFAGYLAGPRVGAAAYDAVHTYIGPLALTIALVAAGMQAGLVLVWFAHIGFDRAMGYGLKYATAFGDTHLGRMGRAEPAPPG